nr:adenosylcobinamide amidohydrolase [Chachezhania sediminis]
MRVLSWALNLPGFVAADRVVFREVRDSDLPEGLDAMVWLQQALDGAGLDDAPTLLTSRSVASYRLCTAQVGELTATCLATVGLSNAERVGRRRAPGHRIGTINIAVETSAGLTEAAQIEALTIATQARTAAVMEAGLPVPGGMATGTGTDCIALAVMPGEGAFAGLHTEVGEAIGRAVYQAVAKGCADWLTHRPDLRGGA